MISTFAVIAARVQPWRDQTTRGIRETITGRVREGLNFFRRTARAALGQPAPRVVTTRTVATEDGGTVRERKVAIIGASRPGDVPFKRTGKLQEHFGNPGRGNLTVSAGQGNVVSVGRITGDLYGWFAGTSEKKRGVVRPIRPVWDDNLDILTAGLQGRIPFPRIGDLSAIAHRRPQVDSAKLKAGSPGRRKTTTYAGAGDGPAWVRSKNRSRRRAAA